MTDVYVLGGSQSDFERNYSKENKSVLALLKEVINDAFIETGINEKEIIRLKKKKRIGIFIGNFAAEYYLGLSHLGPLLTEVNNCFYGIPSNRYEAACASSSLAIDVASSKIRCGDIDFAIVIGFELMKTVDSKTSSQILGRAALPNEVEGIDYPFPKLFDRIAKETIKKYKLNKKDLLNNLSKIVENNYQNAKRNPLSQTRKWFMNYEKINNRGSDSNPYIGDIIAQSDCSQITDGAVCLFLSSKEYLNETKRNIKEYPYIKGWGSTIAPMSLNKKIEESKNSNYLIPYTREAILEAYKKANLKVSDIDAFEAHDCFSISEYLLISAFGITKPGLEYEAIEKGIISFDGKKPINPSGGLIGCGHPVGATGARMFLDLYKQLTNKAGTYQIKDVHNAMMLNVGGTMTTNYCFILSKEK